MTDCSIHGCYLLLRTELGVEMRRHPPDSVGLTVCMGWGGEAGSFLSAFSALQGLEPDLSPAAVLELLWPELAPFATRDN